MKNFIKYLCVCILTFMPGYAFSYDLNNDSWDDIVFSNYVDNNGNYLIDSYIYWGNEAGYSESNRTGLPTTGAKGNSVADLNNDNYLDIVFSSYHDGSSFDVNSHVYWGSASGYSSANRTDLYTQTSWDNQVADLNNDNYLDIVFSSGRTDYNSHIYWGSASGYSDLNRQDLNVGIARDLEIADLNGDNKLDIFFTHRFSETNDPTTESYIYWGTDTGFSDSNRQSITTTGALGSAVADLNKDGKPEIIVAQYNNGETFLYNSQIFWGDDTNPYSVTTQIPTSGATDVTTADLNGDGYLDIIFTNQRDDDKNYHIDSFILWGDETYAYTDKTLLPTVGGSGAAVTDYNKDNYPDIVIANAYDDSNPDGARNINSYIYHGSPEADYTTYIELATLGAGDLSAGPYTPAIIPEPLTVILMGLGLIGLIRRKKA